MKRSIPLLAVILAVQLGLAGLLAVRRNPLAATTPQTPLVTANVENADHVIIEGTPAAGASADSARVELARKDGKWTLPQYFNAPADKFKLNSLLDELAGLKRKAFVSLAVGLLMMGAMYLPIGVDMATLAPILLIAGAVIQVWAGGIFYRAAGPEDAPFGIEVKTERGLSYLMTAPGDLGLGRAYVSGDLVVTGPLLV